MNAFALAASIALLTLPLQNAPAQIDHSHHEEGSRPTNIGRVAFPTSCSAKAQVDFEKGVALLHSFWYEEATKEFDAASAADPACAMAHWGHAMSLFQELWENPDSAARREALTALNTGRQSRSTTPRERAYIDALAQYYEVKPVAPAVTVTPNERLHAYRDAMRDLTRKFPADDEAKIFYGLSIIAAAPYGDTTFTEQKRADSVLLPLVAKYPNHPGLFHYIIHANDAPQLAPLALEAARRYAQLAPAIPHAQHIPSHIFMLLGLWDDVIASNILATETGTAYARAEKMDGEWSHTLHTMDFLQYAYLQEGRDGDAQKIVDKVAHIEKIAHARPSLLRFYQAYFSARQLVETGQWREAAHLRLTTPPDSTSAFSEMILAFTRAVGSGRSGDPATARMEVMRLDSLADYYSQRRDTAASRQVKNLATTASAWLQLALGNRDEAVRLARQGADNENDASETALLPATELEGDLLLAVGKPSEARKAYEVALRRNPNRARSLYGAGDAAAQSGDAVGAARLYSQYITLMQHGDGTRPELLAAKRYVAAR
ncbi:MAG: tetratricopeptide repeat protein [Gemmatimonadaceae bacterium]